MRATRSFWTGLGGVATFDPGEKSARQEPTPAAWAAATMLMSLPKTLTKLAVMAISFSSNPIYNHADVRSAESEAHE